MIGFHRYSSINILPLHAPITLLVKGQWTMKCVTALESIPSKKPWRTFDVDFPCSFLQKKRAELAGGRLSPGPRCGASCRQSKRSEMKRDLAEAVRILKLLNACSCIYIYIICILYIICFIHIFSASKYIYIYNYIYIYVYTYDRGASLTKQQ